MPNCNVELTGQAEKVTRRLALRDPNLYARIAHVIDSLAYDPLQGKPLKGELKGQYSLRVGSHRVLYSVEHHRLVVTVLDIGHRREIYR